MMQRYRAFGLEIDSELELPEFLTGDAAIAPDATIRFGRVSAAPTSAEAVTEWASVNPDGVWLSVDSGDRFHIESGAKITIDSGADSDDATQLMFLLASGFGALLQQRGLLTMHCGAVSTDQGVVGFLGPSGIGKSTTTSAMVAAGHALVTDDILAIDLSQSTESERPIAIPGFPSMKVCRDVLERRGDTTDYAALPSPREKFRVPTGVFSEAPQPVHAFYAIRRAQVDQVLISDPLPQSTAFRVLEREAFRRRFARPMGRRAELFAGLTTLASTTPVHIIRRPAERDSHEELIESVETHIAAAARV